MKRVILFLLFFLIFQLTNAQETYNQKGIIDHFFIETNVGLEKVFYKQRENTPSGITYQDKSELWILGELGLNYRNKYFNSGLSAYLTGSARAKIGVNVLRKEHQYFGPFYTFGGLFKDYYVRTSHSFGLECYFKGFHAEIGYTFYNSKPGETYIKNLWGQYIKVGYAFRLGILKKK